MSDHLPHQTFGGGPPQGQRDDLPAEQEVLTQDVSLLLDAALVASPLPPRVECAAKLIGDEVGTARSIPAVDSSPVIGARAESREAVHQRRTNLLSLVYARRFVLVTSIVAMTVGSAILAKEVRSAPALADIRLVVTEPSADLIESIEHTPDARELPPVELARVTNRRAAAGMVSGVFEPGAGPALEAAFDAAFGDAREAAEDVAALEGVAFDDVTGASNDDPSLAPAIKTPEQLEDEKALAAWGDLVRDAEVRWFDGRPIRPAYTLTMKVTAYSPDERSCPGTADGITATLHSVDTNGHCLVAADPKWLPMGAMITVPGYDESRVVPVLDVGGAIKGKHIDVLFPTHAEARKWGVKRLKVTVWEYADGKPAVSPRKLR